MYEPGMSLFLAGHRGMVGSALQRALTVPDGATIITRDHGQLDLTNQAATGAFFHAAKIDYVVIAAARVGGIVANSTRPADFIYDNLMIAANLIQAAFAARVKGLLFLGSSCIYPRMASQPMRESAMLNGPLEPTNEPYAIAKIAGIKLCESFNRQHGTDFRCVMPTNLYGPGDNFSEETSHVIPALIQRFHRAKCTGNPEVVVWGSGKPRREFLFVDDLAQACIRVMTLSTRQYKSVTTPLCSHLNAGTGVDLTIAELARLIADVVGYRGSITFDSAKPDGTPRKLLNIDRLGKLGWRANTSLEEGLRKTYTSYVAALNRDATTEK